MTLLMRIEAKRQKKVGTSGSRRVVNSGIKVCRKLKNLVSSVNYDGLQAQNNGGVEAARFGFINN
jgi:hypothetical protein